MNIAQVSYNQLDEDGGGVQVVFSYDAEGHFDIFKIWGEPDTTNVLRMINTAPDPELLLIKLRELSGITIH